LLARAGQWKRAIQAIDEMVLDPAHSSADLAAAELVLDGTPPRTRAALPRWYVLRAKLLVREARYAECIQLLGRTKHIAGDERSEMLAEIAASMFFSGEHANLIKNFAATGRRAASGRSANESEVEIAYYCAHALLQEGRAREAEPIAVAVARAAHSSGNRRLEAHSAFLRRSIATAMGIERDAIAASEEHLALTEEASAGATASALRSHAEVLSRFERHAEAADANARALRIARRAGLGPLATRLVAQRIDLLLRLGELGMAVECCAELSGTGEGSDPQRDLLAAEYNARLAVCSRDFSKAAPGRHALLDHVRHSGDPSSVAALLAPVVLRHKLSGADYPDVRGFLGEVRVAVRGAPKETPTAALAAELFLAVAGAMEPTGEPDMEIAGSNFLGEGHAYLGLGHPSICESLLFWTAACHSAPLSRMVPVVFHTSATLLCRLLPVEEFDPASPAHQEALKLLASRMDRTIAADYLCRLIIRLPQHFAGAELQALAGSIGASGASERLRYAALEAFERSGIAVGALDAFFKREPPGYAFRLLGTFAVWRGGEAIEVPRSYLEQTARLIGYLYTKGSSGVSAERMLFDLEGEGALASTPDSLRHIIMRVRQILTPISDPRASCPLLPSARGGEKTYRLSLRESDRIDVSEYVALLSKAKTAAAPAAAELRMAAIDLYKGDFLSELRDDGWAMGIRENLRESHRRAIGDLLIWFSKTIQWDLLREYSGRGFERYPFDESMAISELRIAQDGRDFSRAERVWKIHREASIEALGSEPSPEARAAAAKARGRNA
jgi:DNA-binding SARP family transcriptional activator